MINDCSRSSAWIALFSGYQTTGLSWPRMRRAISISQSSSDLECCLNKLICALGNRVPHPMTISDGPAMRIVFNLLLHCLIFGGEHKLASRRRGSCISINFNILHCALKSAIQMVSSLGLPRRPTDIEIGKIFM